MLLALVALLATLQYQWVGQIGDAERQRMRTGAQARADQFAEDFDGTLTGLFLSFSQLTNVPASTQPISATGPPQDASTPISAEEASRYASEFARWAAASPHARLVRAVYLVRTSAGGSDLQKLAPGRGFEPAAWPSDLAQLKPSFEHAANDRGRSLFLQTVPDIPALLVPITRLRVTELGSEPGRVRIMNLVSMSGSIIVQLDRDYMRRLTELVEQVMSFAGFESGRELRGRTEIEVADLIDAAVAGTKPLIAQNGFTLDRRVSPDLPPIKVNTAAVTRAIENLIGNAVKYSGSRRWIGLTAEAAVTRRGREVRITVEDRGVGIPADEQRRIFEPFFRGRDVLASTVRGSGLGLSLARRVVEAHGGSIGVRSEPGQGSAFTLHLPCEPAGGTP